MASPSWTIYLDYAATTPVDACVMEAMQPFLTESFGNPSSLHVTGRLAAKALDEARTSIARCLNAQPDELVFTGSGTEADNLAVLGVARLRQKQNPQKNLHIITTRIEHAAVENACLQLEEEGFFLTYLEPDEAGFISVEEVAQALRPETILVSIIHGHNEIGTLQPLEEIGGLLRDKNILFHTDAVQTVGKLPIDLKTLPVDYLSFSAHKFYGPKGTGALWVRSGAPRPLPLLYGGGQESGLRSGTQNVAGIVGMARALALCCDKLESEALRLRALQEYFIKRLPDQIPFAEVNGPVDCSLRVPGNVNVSIPGIEGEALVLHLDLAGIAASTGSACHSAVIEPSRIILALGKGEHLARPVLRLSMGRATTKDDLDEALRVLAGIVKRFVKTDVSPALS